MKFTVRRSNPARSISVRKDNTTAKNIPELDCSGMLALLEFLYYLFFSLLTFLRKISGMMMNTAIIAETRKIVGIGTNVVSP